MLSSINPSDVQSVEVLKDAASTAIYGARAANGVIIIKYIAHGYAAVNVVLGLYSFIPIQLRKAHVLLRHVCHLAIVAVLVVVVIAVLQHKVFFGWQVVSAYQLCAVGVYGFEI